MRQPSKLTRLIWDFYRENQQELNQLQYLSQCKVFRRWSVLHINCFDSKVANAIVAARALLAEPINQLRLAQKIQVSVDNKTVACFQVNSDQLLW